MVNSATFAFRAQYSERSNNTPFYIGSQTIRERGFNVGDMVHVGGDYSQKFGIIVNLDDEIPFKAQVKLSNQSGNSSITCWIKSEHLLPYA